MMERLPKDLWIQIFLRLPVKTILRCLLVCKSWQLCIQHPSFITSHLQHQRKDLILVRSIPVDNGKKHEPSKYDDNETSSTKKTKPECYSLHCDDECFTVYAKHELPIFNTEHFRVVGSCNGIICITDDAFFIRHETYLWNPTIKKCVKLPDPLYTFNKIGGFDHELGFGFDEKTNDYKVVRITALDGLDRLDRIAAPLKVEIYSLKSGIWRDANHLALDLGIPIFPRHCSARNHQVYLNGSLHWVGGDWEPSRCMVISFHLGDEVFHCFEPPLEIKNRNFCWMRSLRPVAIQGSLSLIHHTDYDEYSFWGDERELKCSIWMMKKYGDSTSWAKYVDIDLSNKVARVIGLRKKAELLIEIQGNLYSYKPTEGKEFVYLDERELRILELIQEGRTEGM